MKNIGIIGTGNIGKCLIKLMCSNNAHNHLTVSDLNSDIAYELSERFDVSAENNQETIEMSDILFLTVKPDNIKGVCDEINQYTQGGAKHKLTIISSAAGVPVDKIMEWTLGVHNVARCMPNIPIAIREGSILWYSQPENVIPYKHDDYNLITDLTSGPANIWVENEGLIDAGTILSGCSPAYLAKIYGIYIDMGKEMGFSDVQSRRLIQNSFAGTIKMLLDNKHSYIIDQVASEGGSTEKGLEILEQGGLTDIIKRSVDYSMDRIQDIRKKLD